MDNHIKLNQGEDYRIYLVNMIEFDLINSFTYTETCLTILHQEQEKNQNTKTT